jgi:glycine/D-amino acid oxidase-like deaminating enzyme
MKYYMKYLQDKLIDHNVTFETRKIRSLDEICGSGAFDAVVNCTGLGAMELLGDKTLRPVRGQVLRVRAPWIKAFWNFGDHYIIPNSDTVVLGGTKQVGDWSETVDEADTQFILDGVCTLFPSLRDAPIEKIYVGLRPVRDEVRLECYEMARPLGAAGQEAPDSGESPRSGSVVIAHCYGHGGCGITLAMGCAEDLVSNHLLPLMEKRRAIAAV